MPFAVTGPDGPIRFGDPAPAVFEASGNTGPVEWSVDKGGMESAVGDSSVLNPLNWTTTLTVTATDTGTMTEVIKTLEVEATLPVTADWGVENDINPGYELSLPELGPPKFRVLPRTAQWPLVFRSRLYPEIAAVRDFLILHETYPFWLEDPALGELRKVYQDSALRRVGRRFHLYEQSFQVRDYEYVPPANVADIGPFVPATPLLPEYGEGEYGG